MRSLTFAPTEGLPAGTWSWNASKLLVLAQSLCSRRQNNHREAKRFCLFFVLTWLAFCSAPQAGAASIFDFAPQNAFHVVNTNADGFVLPQSSGFMLVGGDNG